MVWLNSKLANLQVSKVVDYLPYIGTIGLEICTSCTTLIEIKKILLNSCIVIHIVLSSREEHS